MLTLSVSKLADGLRPVRLQTDLAPLADLIEMSFSSTMDDNGRAALREMRSISRMGLALKLLGRLNDMVSGINMGYVWVQDGRLVGNVSIYPANWQRDLGQAWIIANVATHPEYRQRGIARHLMHASLQGIQQRGGQHAILQVDYENHAAQALYESLGFIKERAFTTWWRSALAASPPPLKEDSPYITHPRPNEWQAEYELASRQRPNEYGGVAWLKPVHPSLFRRSLWAQIGQVFAMSSSERLIIRSEDAQSILASLWIESGFALTRNRLTFIVEPQAHYQTADALLTTALRRFRSSAFMIEHPADDLATDALLRQHRFFPHRTVWHMRLDL